ncbi:alpha/beta-Hydrolases superfamily protein [Melia azedarach]|uniref:Alpha/beta-Hydrolases superfamily protein n=1 Tax=Melia azedarach TaxID=155640 RepID=A0ACC1XHA9_MELAZ|nr:alpha/beta-Hydrolases superfamily protein [Melia azedarach]
MVAKRTAVGGYPLSTPPQVTKMIALTASGAHCVSKCANKTRFKVLAEKFPSFLPKEVENIKDPFARKLATRIERLPVNFSESSIMSSLVKPLIQSKTSPVVLLHGFDSSCLEWRYTFPLLEEAGLETWAIDILGWGFSDLERLPPCNVASKREHFYQLWKTYIKRPMILVGPSLGAAVAADFAVNHPEAVENLVFIDASVYAEGTGNLTKLPRIVAYAGVYLLKSIPLRLYANVLAVNSISFSTSLDWTNVGRLHCLYPWWEDATVNFMISGGYDVSTQIDKMKQNTLIIWGEDDQIISSKLAVRMHCELPNAILRQIPDCGHLPHVEKPSSVAKLILDFIQENLNMEPKFVSQH